MGATKSTLTSESEDQPPLQASKVPYCTEDVSNDQPISQNDVSRPDEAAGIWVQTDKLWRRRYLKDDHNLMVHFLNEEVLEDDKWLCGKAVMNVDNILGWAYGAWITSTYPDIPRLMYTDSAKRAHIRVHFGGGGCWSKVGTDAKNITDDSKPTMNLDLNDSKLDPDIQRFLVIHEFGHALGLEHEHQRSDFWEVASKFLDIDKMKDDDRLKNKNIDFSRDVEGLPDTGERSEYDPKSVMHYWFDLSWCKEKKYMTLEGVRSDGTLTVKEKEILEGIHERHKRQIVDGPSEIDLKFLQGCYKKVNGVQTNNDASGGTDDTDGAIGFVCPCGDCTIKVYMSGKCPKESSGDFPYLDTGALDKRDRQLLEAQLSAQMKQMIDEFADFRDDIIDSFEAQVEAQTIRVDRVRDYILGRGNLAAFCVKALTTEDEKILKSSESILNIFETLRPYTNFFHYEIIEKLVGKYGTQNDKERLEKYVNCFKVFCKRSVFEVPSSAFHSTNITNMDVKVYPFKYNESDEATPSLGDVKWLINRIEELLEIEGSLHICSIERGCICLGFWIPTCVADRVFPVSDSQQAELYQLGVRILDYTQKKKEKEKESIQERFSKLSVAPSQGISPPKSSQKVTLPLKSSQNVTVQQESSQNVRQQESSQNVRQQESLQEVTFQQKALQDVELPSLSSQELLPSLPDSCLDPPFAMSIDDAGPTTKDHTSLLSISIQESDFSETHSTLVGAYPLSTPAILSHMREPASYPVYNIPTSQHETHSYPAHP